MLIVVEIHVTVITMYTYYHRKFSNTRKMFDAARIVRAVLSDAILVIFT